MIIVLELNRLYYIINIQHPSSSLFTFARFFLINDKRGRGSVLNKEYVSVFVVRCAFVTKAKNLEHVSNLSSTFLPQRSVVSLSKCQILCRD